MEVFIQNNTIQNNDQSIERHKSIDKELVEGFTYKGIYISFILVDMGGRWMLDMIKIGREFDNENISLEEIQMCFTETKDQIAYNPAKIALEAICALDSELFNNRSYEFKIRPNKLSMGMYQFVESKTFDNIDIYKVNQ